MLEATVLQDAMLRCGCAWGRGGGGRHYRSRPATWGGMEMPTVVLEDAA